VIEFEGLVKRFGTRTVLKGLSLTISQGEIVFILGTSGTGKSVLLKTLVGLLRADAGSIRIDGQDVTNFTEEEYLPVRRRCGMVFQHPALFDSLTVLENVAYGLMKHEGYTLEQAAPRARECLAMVGLSQEKDRAIGGAFDALELKLPTQISYGMQKRVSLARTVAVGPSILLFDEPTTGLDPVTTRQINFLIRDLSHQLKTTAIVVSHDMDCALEIADRIVVLDKGEIVAEGTVAEILSSKQPLVVDFLVEAKARGVEA
jgi:phospholipid/cholesterol/gamma-HCH transport system ATP-binding protein